MGNGVIWTAAAAMAALAIAAPASAAWLHKKGNDDPFKSGAEHIAFASEFDGYAAAFRCTSRDDLTLMFIVPEKPEPSHLALASALPNKLLDIVDDGEKIGFGAGLETTPDLTNYRVAASDSEVASIAHAVASARRRFALAGELNGKVVWSKAFSVGGSRRALQPLIDGCKLGD